MNKLPLITTTLAGAALLAGCIFNDGSETKAQAKARFDIQAVSALGALAKMTGADSTSLSMSDSSGLTFKVTEARAFIDKIKLVSGDDSCEDKKEVAAALGDSGNTHDTSDPVDGLDSGDGDCGEGENELNGPFVVDLLTGATTPAMGDLVVAAGNYKKVKIHLDHSQKSDLIVDTTDPLMGNTLYVKGTYSLPGQDEKPFTLMLKFNEEVEMETLAGMQLDAATLNTVLVSIKLDGWLKAMDVGGCLAKPEVAASLAGGLIFSEDTEIGRCLDIEKTVKENIRNSFEVEDDDDHDGKRGDSDDDDGKDSI